MTKLSSYASKSFLLVDDEPFMRELIDRILKQNDAALILRANDGGAALDMLVDKAHGVYCIVSDLNMSPVNGLQFLQAIRSGKNPKIRRDHPFIMLTGSGESAAVAAAMALDVNGYCLKPVEPDKLRAAIDGIPRRKFALKSPEQYRAVALPTAL